MRSTRLLFALACLLFAVRLEAAVIRFVENTSFVLTTGQSIQTVSLMLDRQTRAIQIQIRRPTTGDTSTVWDNTATLRISIDVFLDGVRYHATGESTGGIRSRRGGSEIGAYVLTYHLPSGVQRLGEMNSGIFTAHCTIELLSGVAVSTVILFAEADAEPAPPLAMHQSVVFDTATSAEEVSGDRVLSLTHTAGGSTNRAVFGAVGWNNSGAIVHSTSLTYGGSSMTEQWDVFDDVTTAVGAAGYSLAMGATLPGAQTVTSTIGTGGTIVYQTLGVVSMTGVHQTIPVGTPQFTAENTPDTTSPVELTVTGVGADDLVLDHIQSLSTGAPVVGADQTATLNQDDASNNFMAVSRQFGSSGGVMGWTVTGLTGAMYGAIAFKPSPAEGSGEVTFTACAAAINASTGADVTVTLPAHLTNDLLMIMGLVRDVDDSVTMTGWTAATSTPFDRSTVERYWIFWKRAASAAETNPLFDKSTATGDTYALACGYRGAITTETPLEVQGATATGTADPAPLTGITTLAANALVVAVLGYADNNNASIIATGTDPSAYTEHWLTSITGADGSIGFSEAIRTTAGATGTVSVDFSTAVTAGDGWGGQVFSIKPEPTAAIPPGGLLMMGIGRP